MADNVYIPDLGLKEKLQSLRDNLLAGCALKLFQNNITPGPSDVTGTYTECTFSGYSAQTLSDLGLALLSGSTAQVTSGIHTFTHNGGGISNSVYGWYCVSAGGVLIASSRNGAGPITLNASGQSYSVQVTFTDARA